MHSHSDPSKRRENRFPEKQPSDYSSVCPLFCRLLYLKVGQSDRNNKVSRKSSRGLLLWDASLSTPPPDWEMNVSIAYIRLV